MLLRVMFETVLLCCNLNSTLVQLNIPYASLLVNLFSISLSVLAFQGYKKKNKHSGENMHGSWDQHWTLVSIFLTLVLPAPAHMAPYPPIAP